MSMPDIIHEKGRISPAMRAARRSMSPDFQKQLGTAEQHTYYDNLVGARDYLAERLEEKIGKSTLNGWIVCGSGIGSLPDAEGVKILDRIPMDDPHLHFLTPQAPGHGKEIIIADIAGQTVGIQTGRTHPYDTDYSPQQLRLATAPLVVAKGLGVDWLISTSAVGALDNGHIQKGDVVVNEDYTNNTGLNPLLGPNDSRLGQRFPGKTLLADTELLERIQGIIPDVHAGLYVLAEPPLYEGYGDVALGSMTQLTADNPDWVVVFGMSLPHEAAVMLHANTPSTDSYGFDRHIPFLSLSLVSNVIPKPKLPRFSEMNTSGSANPTSEEEVLQSAKIAEQFLIPAVKSLCASLTQTPLRK